MPPKQSSAKQAKQTNDYSADDMRVLANVYLEKGSFLICNVQDSYQFTLSPGQRENIFFMEIASVEDEKSWLVLVCQGKKVYVVDPVGLPKEKYQDMWVPSSCSVCFTHSWFLDPSLNWPCEYGKTGMLAIELAKYIAANKTTFIASLVIIPEIRDRSRPPKAHYNIQEIKGLEDKNCLGKLLVSYSHKASGLDSREKIIQEIEEKQKEKLLKKDGNYVLHFTPSFVSSATTATTITAATPSSNFFSTSLFSAGASRLSSSSFLNSRSAESEKSVVSPHVLSTTSQVAEKNCLPSIQVEERLYRHVETQTVDDPQEIFWQPIDGETPLEAGLKHFHKYLNLSREAFLAITRIASEDDAEWGERLHLALYSAIHSSGEHNQIKNIELARRIKEEKLPLDHLVKAAKEKNILDLKRKRSEDQRQEEKANEEKYDCKKDKLKRKKHELEQKEQGLEQREQDLEQKEQELKQKEQELKQKEQELRQKEQEIKQKEMEDVNLFMEPINHWFSNSFS